MNYSIVLKNYSYFVDQASKNSSNIRLLETISGNAFFKIKGKSIRLSPGQVVLWQAGESFSIEPFSNNFNYTVIEIGICNNIKKICFSDTYKVYTKIENLIIKHDGAINFVDKISTHQRMLKLLNIYINSSSLDKSTLIQYTLYSILKNVEHNLEEIKPIHPYNCHIQNALKYIQENYTNNILTIDIADHVGIHQNYLHKLFYEHTGLRIVDYLNKLRLKHAKHLLASSDLDIEDIARQCSYENSKYFYRIFKKYELITPSKYRKTYNKTLYPDLAKHLIVDKGMVEMRVELRGKNE